VSSSYKPALFVFANLPCLRLQTCLVCVCKPALFGFANLPCLRLFLSLFFAGYAVGEGVHVDLFYIVHEFASAQESVELFKVLAQMEKMIFF